MNFQASERLSGVEKSVIRQINDLAKPDAINLGLGEPDFKTPEPIGRRAAEFIAQTKFGYTPNAGLKKLRALIAKDSGFDADENYVCVMNGAQEALFVAIQTLVNTGDEVLIGNPAFLAYKPLVKLAGGIPLEFDLRHENNFAVEASSIEKKLTGKTKLIILSSPANPTGAIDSEKELKKIAGLIENKNCYIISDEVYRRIWFERPPVSIGNFSKKVITISSLSKTFAMTGWRLGWTLAHPEITKQLTVMRQYVSTCASAISQEAGIHALEGHAGQEAQAMIDEYRVRRDLMIRAIQTHPDLNFIKPEGTFYLLLDVHAKMAGFGNSLEMAKKLLGSVNVVTVPGSAFGSNAEGYLRLSFAASRENIEEGISRIGKFFSS
jgi:aspartate/methionine/tyrosine aminotransferase